MKVILKKGRLVLVPETETEGLELACWKEEQAGHVAFVQDTAGEGLLLIDLGVKADACREPINVTSQSIDPQVKLNPVLRQRGTIAGLDAGIPLAVAVNGRIAAVGESFDDNGKVRYSILLPETALEAGENQIALYQVGTAGNDAAGPFLTELWSSTG